MSSQRLQTSGDTDVDFLDDLLSWQAPTSPSRLDGGLSPSSVPINVAVTGAGTSPKPSEEAAGPPAAPKDSPLVFPAEVEGRLFGYQKEGIQWLYRKHRHARACLLADEMGLGKTIQVCTFLGLLYRMHTIRTTLVIVPPTLVPMWESALLEWGQLPRNVVEVVHREGKAKRGAHWKKLSFGLPRVMVTTYGVLRQDVREMSATMVDYVVLDEAHTIKNADTDASRAALQLSTRHKIALTGTPLMNNFNDLWAVFEFLDGDIISSNRRQFKKVNLELLSGNERDASPGARQAAREELAKLRLAIQPYMLRREKKDVKAVECRKHDTVLWVTLSETQKQLYRAVLQQDSSPYVGLQEAEQEEVEVEEVEEAESAAAVDANGADASSLSSSSSSPSPGSSGNALRQVTMLTQVCNHPWLQLTEGALTEALTRSTDAAPLCEEVGDIHSGTKLCAALTLLERCVAEGRKALVFSRSKVLLRILARLMTAKRLTHTRIDGDITNASERMKAVDAFNADPSVKVCLLTTQVGGVGLTFCSASCVILLDPSWNPAADTQAMDRVHRIGQVDSDVFMFRLITCGTIEEKIYRNQVFKTMAAKQATQSGQGQPSHFFRYFTRMQLRAMFVLDNLTQSETAAQLTQVHQGGVAPQVLALTKDVPYICAVSDNGCVLNETVAEPEAAEAKGAAVAEADDDLEMFLREEAPPLESLKRQRSPEESQPREAAPSPFPLSLLSSSSEDEQPGPLEAAAKQTEVPGPTSAFITSSSSSLTAEMSLPLPESINCEGGDGGVAATTATADEFDG